MVEAPEYWACEACFDTSLQADGETPCPCQDSRLPRLVRDLKRQIAELRAERDAAQEDARVYKETADGNSEIISRLAAENARLRALPLKDEVERVLEPLAQIADKHHSGYPDNEFSMPIVRVGELRAARALLSRLREGQASAEVVGLDEYEGQITDPIERVVADRNREARIRAAAPSEQGGGRDANR